MPPEAPVRGSMILRSMSASRTAVRQTDLPDRFPRSENRSPRRHLRPVGSLPHRSALRTIRGIRRSPRLVGGLQRRRRPRVQRSPWPERAGGADRRAARRAGGACAPGLILNRLGALTQQIGPRCSGQNGPKDRTWPHSWDLCPVFPDKNQVLEGAVRGGGSGGPQHP